MSIIDDSNALLKKVDLSALEEKAEVELKNQASLEFKDPRYVISIKDYNKLNELIFTVKEIHKKLDEHASTSKLIGDQTIGDMASDDLKNIESDLRILTDKLKELTRKPLEDDNKKAIIEIRPGVGGIEASLFAEDLFRMYVSYCNLKRLKVREYSIGYNSEGGINEAVFLIDEPESYGLFRFESGVHRVQRVPTTEAAGRIHTSTASVVVMPEMPETTLEVDPNDLRVDVYRSSGPGGQSVNTTDSAVRITHLPTKITVTSQNSRSQQQNKEVAMRILMSKLYEIEKQKKQSTEEEIRSESIKGGDRSAKIRTYNFPQGRITDHRIGQSWFNIQQAMNGEVENIISTVSTTLRGE